MFPLRGDHIEKDENTKSGRSMGPGSVVERRLNGVVGGLNEGGSGTMSTKKGVVGLTRKVLYPIQHSEEETSLRGS